MIKKILSRPKTPKVNAFEDTRRALNKTKVSGAEGNLATAKAKNMNKQAEILNKQTAGLSLPDKQVVVPEAQEFQQVEASITTENNLLETLDTQLSTAAYEQNRELSTIERGQGPEQPLLSDQRKMGGRDDDF